MQGEKERDRRKKQNTQRCPKFNKRHILFELAARIPEGGAGIQGKPGIEPEEKRTAGSATETDRTQREELRVV